MIKPEDVPKSLVYDVYAQMKRCLELDELGTPVSTEQQIADLLNLCVEAGVVSPPVYTVRDKDGYLLDDGVYGLWSNPDRALDGHEDGYTAEHHRGQTE